MRKEQYVVLLSQYLQNSFPEVEVFGAIATKWTVVILDFLTLCFTSVWGELENYNKRWKNEYLKAETNSVEC